MRSAYIPHDRVQSHAVGKSLTKQSFRDETEINNILAKYAKTGLVDHVNKFGSAQYGDMPNQADFHEAMNLVTSAQAMFAELPAELRKDFGNDPAKFLEFVSDPESHDEMVEMGLIPTPAPAPELTLDPDGNPSVEMPEAPPEASQAP